MSRRLIALSIFLTALTPTATFADTEAKDPDAFYTLRIGDSMPEVDFQLADGTKVERQDLLGGYVLIDFWATWCAPCIATFPKLNELESRFSDRPIDFYSVTYEPASMTESVLVQNPLETPIGFDNDFTTFSSFRAWGIPATYIFDPEGTLVSALHPADLTSEVLDAVLAGKIPEVEQSRGWEDPEGAEEYFRSLVE